MRIWQATKVIHTEGRRILPDHILGVPIHQSYHWITQMKRRGHFWWPWSIPQCWYSRRKMHHIKIEGEFVDIMCEVDPEHRENVWMENCVNVLYMRLFKVLYGCMESELLCYGLYMKTLKLQGFVVNPYDRYIANSTIDGKQYTVHWYVGDNKL